MSELPSHSSAFRLRRFANWFPLGLTYAFLYMGRYNLTVSKNALGDLMTKEDFGIIFAAGTFTYAFAFLINGPLVDRIGGKRGILIGAMGSAIVNLIMGLYIATLTGGSVCETAPHLRLVFSILYAVNMYFQSYGAVAIVKVNAHWFHVRERGGFSGIFGTMISSGIFFAFTVNGWILSLVRTSSADFSATKWVFYTPAAVLLVMFGVELFLLKDRPGQAGHQDFDTGDASSGEAEGASPTLQIIKRIFTNPVIITVALIEFCTGVLRNGVMHWYPIYAKEVLALPNTHYMRYGDWSNPLNVVPFFVVAAISFYLASRSKGARSGWLYVAGGLAFLAPFMQAGWGGILFVAGVIGANVAGWLSDLLFQSRRAPTAGFLYLGCAVAAIGIFFTLGTTTNEVAWSQGKAGQAASFDTLQPGDRIVDIAGQQNVSDWQQIGKAVACLPARCECAARWDTRNCTCASKPEQTRENLATSDGTIAATVLRDGKRLELRLRDPRQKMYAGDRRRLPAGPVLPMSPFWLGLVVFFVSLCVIGTHGLLSGTATMDFGGRKGAATAVGLIDGFVYLGTGVQSLSLGYLTTNVGWHSWPIFLFPFALIGFLLLLRIWKVMPKGRGGH
jgi:sugar phosphate permease